MSDHELEESALSDGWYTPLRSETASPLYYDNFYSLPPSPVNTISLSIVHPQCLTPFETTTQSIENPYSTCPYLELQPTSIGVTPTESPQIFEIPHFVQPLYVTLPGLQLLESATSESWETPPYPESASSPSDHDHSLLSSSSVHQQFLPTAQSIENQYSPCPSIDLQETPMDITPTISPVIFEAPHFVQPVFVSLAEHQVEATMSAGGLIPPHSGIESSSADSSSAGIYATTLPNVTIAEPIDHLLSALSALELQHAVPTPTESTPSTSSVTNTPQSVEPHYARLPYTNTLQSGFQPAASAHVSQPQPSPITSCDSLDSSHAQQSYYYDYGSEASPINSPHGLLYPTYALYQLPQYYGGYNNDATSYAPMPDTYFVPQTAQHSYQASAGVTSFSPAVDPSFGQEVPYYYFGYGYANASFYPAAPSSYDEETSYHYVGQEEYYGPSFTPQSGPSHDVTTANMHSHCPVSNNNKQSTKPKPCVVKDGPELLIRRPGELLHFHKKENVQVPPPPPAAQEDSTSQEREIVIVATPQARNAPLALQLATANYLLDGEYAACRNRGCAQFWEQIDFESYTTASKITCSEEHKTQASLNVTNYADVCRPCRLQWQVYLGVCKMTELLERIERYHYDQFVQHICRRRERVHTPSPWEGQDYERAANLFVVDENGIPVVFLRDFFED